MKVTKTVDIWGVIRYKNEKGEWHREDGPAVEYTNGTIAWWINGKRHREDGPAWIDGDYKEWWFNGKLHREDGPAIIEGDCKEYWLNGEQYYNKEEFEDYILKKKLQKVKGL